MTAAMESVTEPLRAGLRDRALVLRAHPIFEGLDDEGLLLVAEHARVASYDRGAIIAVEGEPARSVHLIVSGEIAITRAGRRLTSYRGGDAYGALRLLARDASTSAVAQADTHTLELPAAAFESSLIENFSLLRNALRQLGQAVLDARGNLPSGPGVSRDIDAGHYYEQPRSMVERLLQLRAGPFGRMNLEALVDLARLMVEVRYRAGEVLWASGDVSTHALHIDAGTVRCTGRDGRVAYVGRGFTIGVMDVWSRTRVYEACTETPVIGFRTAFESFLALIEAHPEMGIDLLRGFARDLLDLTHAA